MASGRDGPIPYKAIGSDWKDFMDELKFPKDIVFQDPCKYLTDASNQILKLWRARQDRDEIPFKFNFIFGFNKEPEVTGYPNGIFDDLHPAGLLIPQILEESQQRDCTEESEEEGSEEEPRFKKSKAAWSNDEEEEVEPEGSTEERGTLDIIGPQGDDLIQHRVKKPGRPRKVISSEEDESPRVTPHRRPRANSPANVNSSPTLAGSSPIVQGKTTHQPLRGRSIRSVVLPTPEPSQTHTPTPEPSRELRSRMKPTQIPQEPEEGQTAGRRVRTRSKGALNVERNLSRSTTKPTALREAAATPTADDGVRTRSKRK